MGEASPKAVDPHTESSGPQDVTPYGVASSTRQPSATLRSVAPNRDSPPSPIGWREWVALPGWGVDHTKAKIDTGARTSSLHAFDLEWFERDDDSWVRFEIHPWQRSTHDPVTVEATVHDTRDIRSSSGRIERRPIVRTVVRIAGIDVESEITLTRRDEMGFRMLIGREALRRRFTVDPGRSYIGGRPASSIRRKNRGR